MLSPGVPPAEKERAENAVQTSQAELDRLQPEVDAAQKAHDEAQREAQEKSTDFKDAKQGRIDYVKLVDKFDIAKRKLKTAQQEAKKDNRKEKATCIKNIRKFIKMYITELEDASTAHKEYVVAVGIKTSVAMSEDGLLEKKRVAEEQLAHLLSQSHLLQNEHALKSSLFDQARRAVLAKRTEADRLAPIGTADEPTPLKALLDDLPDGKTQLEDLMDEAQQNITRILHNPEALRTYEEQKEKLDTQRKSYEFLKDSKGLKRSELASLKEPYVASLTNIVAMVNDLFMKYMGELGCAGRSNNPCYAAFISILSLIHRTETLSFVLIFIGEIEVYTGERAGPGEEQLQNFKDWGIQIKVKFRANSDLQVLSAQVHSGGERSVSTIMYLMAMQDLMVSPFRCVDEINQGLDERNERLVFKRIVQNSTSKPKHPDQPHGHSGQYFLITPKLLPNLTDMEQDDVTVMCIFNGIYNFDHYSDWNVDNLLNMKKRFIDHEDGGRREKLCRVEEKKEA